MRYAIVALILSFAVAAPVVAVSFPGRAGEYSQVAPGAFLRVPTNVLPGVPYGSRPITIRKVPPILPARPVSALERQAGRRTASLASSADARTARLKADVAARQRLLAEQRQALASLDYGQSSRATWSSKAAPVAAPVPAAPVVAAAEVVQPPVAVKPSRTSLVGHRSTIADEVAARKASLKVAHKLKGPRTLGPPPPFRYKNTKLYRSWGSGY